MTHDKLLQEITTEFSGSSQFGGSEKIYQALRAVVELHKPEGDRQQQCEHDKKTYPCPTIQAIEKELK